MPTCGHMHVHTHTETYTRTHKRREREREREGGREGGREGEQRKKQRKSRRSKGSAPAVHPFTPPLSFTTPEFPTPRMHAQVLSRTWRTRARTTDEADPRGGGEEGELTESRRADPPRLAAVTNVASTSKGKEGEDVLVEGGFR